MGRLQNRRQPSFSPFYLRLPVALLERIKLKANKHDMPYQSLIKAWLAQDIDQQRPG